MKFLRVLGKELVLGTLIAILGVFTALASFQGSMADSELNKYEILGMQQLNDGNAEYLSASAIRSMTSCSLSPRSSYCPASSKLASDSSQYSWAMAYMAS